jgi:hypothetical protein
MFPWSSALPGNTQGLDVKFHGTSSAVGINPN